MSIVVNAADRLLGAIVPRATAAALTCGAGYHRVTCQCVGGYFHDACCTAGNKYCTTCVKTVWPCG